jgi:hypothetical protein
MNARHPVESSRSISKGTQNPQLKTRRNTAKILVGITVVFLISYVPYHVLWAYIICKAKRNVSAFAIIKIIPDKIYNLQYKHLGSTYFLSINSIPIPQPCSMSGWRLEINQNVT